jgi:hypothetical protein
MHTYAIVVCTVGGFSFHAFYYQLAEASTMIKSYKNVGVTIYYFINNKKVIL